MASEGRNDHVTYYGPWAWIGGFLISFGIIYLMFSVADGFS